MNHFLFSKISCRGRVRLAVALALAGFALAAQSQSGREDEAGKPTTSTTPAQEPNSSGGADQLSGDPIISKLDGEAMQIKERDRYFWSMRGVSLADTARQLIDYSAQRAQAMTELKAQIEGGAHRGAGTWTALGPAGATMLNWTMSPVSGRISAFAQSPATENTLFVGGATGGVWRSTNGGTSWSPVFDSAGTQTIGSIWIEPGNASRVWVGTGERGNSCVGYFGQGLYLSTDGGSNFAARNGSGSNPLTLSYVTSISTSPSPSSTVLVSGTSFCNGGAQQSGGIFRSTDSGANWSKVVQGAVEDVIFQRSNGQIAYAAANGNGVLKSSDGGANWVRLGGGLPTVGTANVTSIGTIRVRLAEYDSNRVFALVRYTANAVTQTDLYRSSNAGTNWTRVRANVCDGQCDYNVTFDVSPRTPSNLDQPTMVLGFVRPYLSTNGGINLSVMTNSWGSTQQVHQDTHVVRFARVTTGPASNALWIGGDGGLWRTDNLGSSYTNLNNGLSLAQFYDIAVHPTQANSIFGGTQDNSSMGRFGSNLWNVNVANGDGGTTLVDNGNPSIVFAFGYTPFANGLPTLPSMWRSGQSGAANSFAQISTSGLINGEPYSFITKGANATGWVFVGSHSIYRAPSNVAGGSMSWTKIANNLTAGAPISVITPARKLASDPLALYVGDVWGRVYRVWNVTATNTPATANVTNGLPSGVISDIAVDPNNMSRIFVTRGAFGGNKLYYSGDQAATWIARGGGLPDVPVNSVAVHPSDGAKIYVATDIGVYRSFDGGVSFQSYNPGLPLGSVAVDLEIQASTGQLYVATYGRGVYAIDL